LIFFAGTLDEFDFRLAYLEKRATKGVHFSPELFQEQYLSIEAELKTYGIRTLSNIVEKELPQNDSLLLALHSRYNTWINGHQADRTTEAISHDVRMLEYVRRTQATSADTIDEAGIVFLTCDRLLARFAASESTRGRRIPACVTVETWMQYVAPLLPRLDDYEAGFLNFLSSPFMTQSPLSFDDAAQVLTRIETHAKRSDEAAVEMLYGTRARRFAATIAGKAPAEKERLIDDTYAKEVDNVDSRFQKDLADAARALEEREARSRELESLREKELVERRQLEETTAKTERERATLREKLETEAATRQDLESTLARANESRLAALADAAAATGEIQTRKRQASVQGWVISVLLAIVALLVTWDHVRHIASASLAGSVIAFWVLNQRMRNRSWALRWCLPAVVCGSIGILALISWNASSANNWLNQHQGFLAVLQVITPFGLLLWGWMSKQKPQA
jgi:hypothetical protein